ncbi:MAG: hypothetical protein KY462_09940 [Actinobacteria bacterium]|nr:hypothetical protein [Actinomycetota bacterium]
MQRLVTDTFLLGVTALVVTVGLIDAIVGGLADLAVVFALADLLVLVGLAAAWGTAGRPRCARTSPSGCRTTPTAPASAPRSRRTGRSPLTGAASIRPRATPPSSAVPGNRAARGAAGRRTRRARTPTPMRLGLPSASS